MEYPNGDWFLVTEIIKADSIQKLVIVYRKDDEFKQRCVDIAEPLFYVGADVWELEFGSILMTLEHPTLLDHPAMKLWMEWLNFKSYKC